jgi:hypothetical protein
MRVSRGHLILLSLAFVLTGCAVPYYPAPPAPVYFPLQRAAIYYPAQPTSPAHAVPRVTRAHRHSEAHKEALRSARRHGAGNSGGSINPKPIDQP